jgi:hypothetical protein
VHEAPLLLAAPQSDVERTNPALPAWVGPALRVIGMVLGVLAALVVIVIGLSFIAAILASLAGVLLVVAVFGAMAAALDPVLIAVTEDGYWIEIDRWES